MLEKLDDEKRKLWWFLASADEIYLVSVLALKTSMLKPHQASDHFTRFCNR